MQYIAGAGAAIAKCGARECNSMCVCVCLGVGAIV